MVWGSDWDPLRHFQESYAHEQYVISPVTNGTCSSNNAIYDPTALDGAEVSSCALYLSWQRAPTTHGSSHQAPRNIAYSANATRLKLVLLAAHAGVCANERWHAQTCAQMMPNTSI